jgi:DNA-binding transcriptional MerR regulator
VRASAVPPIPDDEIGPTPAAKILGVSSWTVRHYVDTGLLPARVLPSGHRKISRADVERLAREIAAGVTR